MLLFIIFSLSCSLVTSQVTKGCCVPDVFSAHEREISMYVVGGESHLMQGRSDVYFDHANNIVAVEQFTDIDGNPSTLKIVVDYNKNIMYRMQDTSCTSFAVPPSMRIRCVPADAVWTGSAYYGLMVDGEALWVDTYTFPAGNDTVYFSVTQDGCFPVTELIQGHINGVHHMVTSTFTNPIEGILDNSVFDLLPSCGDNISRNAKTGTKGLHVGHGFRITQLSNG